MMFSTRSEYGVRVMVSLAREQAGGGGAPHSLTQIAEAEDLPLAYLEHLAASLKKAGLVDSRRGARGGYLLTRAAGEITMAEIIEALEGQIAPIECITEGADGHLVCTRESTTDHICPTKVLWTRVQGSIVRTLRDIKLADLVQDEPARRRVGAVAAEPPAARAAAG